MNSEWIAIDDCASGRRYYANRTTGITQWQMPYGFDANSQPYIPTNNHQNHQSEIQTIQSGAGGDPSKWNKAYDPKTGNYYWWHSDTKETRWSMPAIASQSIPQFDAIWGSGSDNNSNSGDWDQDEDDDDTSDSDSDLEVYNPKLLGQSLVDDAPTNSDSDQNDDEKVPNRLDNEEEIIVSDTPNTYWDFAKNHGKKYTLTAYAAQYFQTHKHNRMFKKCDIDELIKFAPYNKVNHALLKMDSKLDKTGQQIWKNINSYMLLRKSSKSDCGHIDKLLRFALKAPEVLRDEIFCQLCKQTHHNPSVESMVKGWKLMSVCCSVFPPSDEFAKYLATYLFGKSKESGVIGEYATFALHALDRTMALGQRRIQPTDREIQRIEERQPISIKVYFADATFKTVLVTSQTQSQQVTDELIKTLKLNHGESFGLFEMEQVKSNHWVQSVYDKRKGMNVDDKVDGLQYMPHDRELEVNERIMDVYSSWSKNKMKKEKQLRLVFKCKIHSKAQRNSYAYNDWRLAFLSEVWNVVHGMYPVEEDDIYHLAAIQLQATHGVKEDTFYASGLLQDMMDRYVPHTMMHMNDVSQLETKILSKHELYRHLDKRDAFSKYIEYLKLSTASSYCGCEFFRCVKRTRLRRAENAKNIDLLVGISENGILLMNPITLEIVDRYKMEEIITYGFRAKAFLLVAGTLMCQRKFQFATMLGKQMNDALKQHIGLRVQQAEVQGYSFQH